MRGRPHSLVGCRSRRTRRRVRSPVDDVPVTGTERTNVLLARLELAVLPRPECAVHRAFEPDRIRLAGSVVLADGAPDQLCPRRAGAGGFAIEQLDYVGVEMDLGPD